MEPRDLPAIEAGIRDPDVIRWIGPAEGSAADALVQAEERWAQGWPTLAICGPDAVCVGKIWIGTREGDGLTGFVGYWLLPGDRGQGFATAAVRLLSKWALERLGLTSVRLTTAPDNAASQGVAERSGFRRVLPRDGEAVDEVRGDDLVYELQEHLGG